MFKMETAPKRKRMKNLFRTDYLIKLKREDIEKYGAINNKTITITDKKLSYCLMKENLELKQKLLAKGQRELELEKEILELKKQLYEQHYPLAKQEISEADISRIKFNLIPSR